MNVVIHSAPHSSWGLRSITIDNGVLRCVVLPEAGAKIISIVHRPSGKELLWRNAAQMPARLAPGAVFDDTWAGGWDELFPNDEPARLDGRVYPNHGEMWTNAWHADLRTDGDSAELALSTECAIAGCRMEKRITLRAGEAKIHFHHRLTNLGNRVLRGLWKLHPAFAVAPGDRVLIPARRYALEPACLASFEGAPLSWEGPVVEFGGRRVDVREVLPASSRELRFLYGLDLEEGWCAVYDPTRRLAAGLAFPKDLINTCWLFATYGGWRDHYVAVLEPCAGYPFQLEAAARAGQAFTLAPHGTREARVVFAARAGLPGVRRITAEGEIEAV
jgi:hypothetical protein